MGQHFRLCNLDSPVAVANSVGNRLSVFYYCRMDEDDSLLRALRQIPNEDKRVVVLPVHKIKGYVFPQESCENFSEGFFGQLTTEIIDKIFGEVNKLVNLLSLMTTCQRHWDIGGRHLERVIKDSFIVSWAGDRLICLGDYTELEDLPKGILTEYEVNNIKEFYKYDSRSSSLWRAIRAIQPPRCTMRAISSSRDLMLELESRYGASESHWFTRTNISGALQNLIHITDMCFDDFYAGHMVFRNLTLKEYIRGDIWNMPGDSRFIGKRLTFEHVLYIRIIWTSGYHLPSGDPLDHHQGVWAGHRLDISDIQSVVDEDGIMVDGWKDVTNEVINEVLEIMHF